MKHKKALVIASTMFYLHDSDEWDSFRNEGRVIINIGFGLSLLGYDVNIVCSNWNLDKPKTTWNNIQLSKTPIYNYYDTVLSFSAFTTINNITNIEFNNGASLILYDNNEENTKVFEKLKGMNLKYCYVSKKFADTANKKLNKDTYYLPPLFPISSIHTGFVPFSYKPNLPELKVYLHYSSWSQNTTISGNRFLAKEHLIIEYLKSKGYKLKLTVLVENKEAQSQCNLNHDDITFHYSNECNYKDIINLTQSADICITNGAPAFAGNGLFDIIALGKPLIYIADGRIGNEWIYDIITLIYNCPENLIYIQDLSIDTVKKLDYIMKNLYNEHKRYVNAYKDCNFDTWKHIAKEVFDIDEEYLTKEQS